MSWAPPAILGVFVLGPAASRDHLSGCRPTARLDVGTPVLLVVLAGALVLVFGPFAIPAPYVVMPVMMLLGWRHGLLGAGLGAMVAIVVTLGLTAADWGIVGEFRAAGFGAQVRGSYLELFFIVAILSSLPLAIVCARQRATDTKLVEALGAAEFRAEQLAASEAAARKAEALALQSEAAALQARQELGRVIETSIDIICSLDADGTHSSGSARTASRCGAGIRPS
jgi:hypothetical protein